MSTTRLALRTFFVAAVTSSLAFAATPANALASPVLAPAVAIPTVGTYNAVPHCNFAPGVATNLQQITYAVDGFGESYSTNGTLPVATGITCWIEDTVTGEVYGSVSHAMPGPYAVTAGLIAVPFDSSPKLCGTANALFTNNATATGTTLGC